jgi:hypothetical protein
MTQEEKQKSIDALQHAALKAIRFGYLDLASQIMFVAETLERNSEDNLVNLPVVVLSLKRDAAN